MPCGRFGGGGMCPFAPLGSGTAVKFQGDTLNFCNFIQLFVFTTNHHLKEHLTVFRQTDI